MKTIFILLSLVLSGCDCMLSQIPPQTIYCESGCTAALPDFRSKIKASDNCEIASFTQVPLPGFLLTPAAKTTNVTIKATDKSGNFRQVTFTVTMIDTIKPTLVIDPSLLTYQKAQVEKMYDIADRAASYAKMDMTQLELSQYPELVRFLNTATFNRLVIVKK